MTEDKRTECMVIIHGCSTAAGAAGAGLAQIPCSDSAVIVPIQIGMAIALGAVFGVELSESGAKALVESAAATAAGRSISQMLVGWIPGLGNALNAATAAALTETIGWQMANSFADR